MLQGDEIRILALLPHHGNSKAEIICEFSKDSLAKHPKYEALSYVWGTQSQDVPISISDGRRLKVTRTLYTALSHLRLPEHRRMLWIDQLCINQEDGVEKMNQIRLMRSIYSQCSRCIIWLGECKDVINMTDAENASLFINYLATPSHELDHRLAPTCVRSDLDRVSTRKALRAMSALKNEWWHRMWTLQEAVLPPASAFQLGSVVIPWTTMLKATEQWVMGRVPKVTQQRIGPHLFKTLNSLRCQVLWIDVSRGFNDPFLFLIFKWRGRRASEPRDKVFSLLGLRPAGELSLCEKCDYDTPVAEVYASATLDHIRLTRGLKALMVDPRLDARLATANISRWALDLNSPVSKRSVTWAHFFAYHWYDANAGQQVDMELLSGFDKPTSVLGLKAALVDEIAEVYEEVAWVGSPSTYSRTLHNQLVQRLRGWLSVVTALGSTAVAYPGCGYDYREAFGRLVLGDLVRDDQRHPQRWATNAEINEALRFAQDASLSGQGDSPLLQDLYNMPQNQKFFVTRKGLIGLGHWDSEPGDQVWIFGGGQVPFTARRQLGNEKVSAEHEGVHLDFMGWTYVQGIMRGEFFRDFPDRRLDQSVYIH